MTMDPISRREFLIQTGGAAACAIATAAAGFAQQTTPSAKRVLHIIGYSHIDAAWLWPWRDGSNLAFTTMRSALDRMRETHGFCYTHSSSAHYRWVQRADPRMFDEIRQRVREGRWEVVGAWPVEPDCNIPATESFVRHSLYGKRYVQDALGVDIAIGFNPDSFGHAAGLPTILRAAGYRYYVFMRPEKHEMDLPILFWWEAPDGSRVLALRIWKTYSAPGTMIPDAAKNVFQPGMDHGAFFLGVGDHGGAVTREHIHQVESLRSDSSLPELRYSTVAQFFRTVERSPSAATLPVVRSELQHHARGCYSAYGPGKLLNRRAERWLVQAETISLVANVDAAHQYPAQDYAEAWWRVCFNQFHDMLAGTAMYSDYEDVRDSVGSACETAQTSKVEALETLAKRVDLRGIPEGAVFVFNPLPWPRKALVEYHTEQNPSHNAPITHLAAPDGSKIPLQWRPAASMTQFWRRLSAWVDVPACGYSVFELADGEPPAPHAFGNFFAVSDRTFGMSSLKSSDGTELFAGPLGLVVISDPSDTWAHGVNSFRDEIGRPEFVSSEVVENGPVTRVTRQRAHWRNSEIILDIAQFAAIDAIELRFVIDWSEHEQILKLELPLALANPRVFAKVPGAAIERHTNGDEEPYQDWVAVQGGAGGAEHTVALLNDGTYSYDCQNALLRTILIRSAPFARHNPWKVPPDDNNAWQDQGRQERRFWIVRSKGAWTTLNLDRLAQEMQTPAEYVIDSAHEGSEPRTRSFFEIMPQSVEVLAIKRAEQGDDVIVRLQERAGSQITARVRSPMLKLDHSVTLQPWELKTLLVSRGGQVREVSVLER